MELIVAIAIIEIGLFSVWSLFYVNFSAEREAELRIVGVNLAREGIEVVRSIRDSNWLKSAANQPTTDPQVLIWPWDEGLEPGTFSVNYDSVIDDENPTLGAADHDQLYYNTDGFFTNINAGSPTPFKRQITLNNICCVDNNPQDLICDDNSHDSYQILDAGDDCPVDSLKIGVNVVSTVSWFVRGQQRRSIVEDNFYNWK